MSETDQTQDVQPNDAPPETDVPFEEPEPDSEPTPDSAPGTEPDVPTEPTEPTEPEAQAQGLSEAEIEEVGKKLDGLRKHVARKVGDIFGEDAVALIPCPTCEDGPPGHVWMQIPNEVKDDVLARVHAWLGIAAPADLQPHPNAELCTTCQGLGSVKTPSKVPGYDVVDCPECAATGRVLTQAAQPSLVTGPTAAQPPFTPPPANGGSELPPALQEARDAGWTIVPPFHIPTEAPQV